MRTHFFPFGAVLRLATACCTLAACSSVQEQGHEVRNQTPAPSEEVGAASPDASSAQLAFPDTASEPVGFSDASSSSESLAFPDASSEPAAFPDASSEPATFSDTRSEPAAFSDARSEPYAQRAGDPQRGRQLLLDNGTSEVPYMSCGIPEAVVRLAGLDSEWSSALKIPDRRDSELPYDANYLVRPSGVKLVTTNCLFCHAAKLGGQLVIGLPESNRDFTQADVLTGLSGATLRVAAGVLLDDPTKNELARALRIADASAAFPHPDTIGINPADSMFGVLAMNRDPISLRWLSEPDPQAGPIPKRIIFTDVPALWNTHRRPHLFNSGFAHGDLARVMMTASLLCLEDRAEAELIDAYFPDIRAYIHSLRAPKFEALSGLTIDGALAARGEAHYASLCRGCHGDKDGEGSAPRTFVPLSEVGTDPIYAVVTAEKNDLPEGQTINYFFNFFNRSWYGTEGAAGKLVRPATPGYVPPPLDGVWATAPYFHNGSVPTLDAVLDPKLRPRIFERSFDPDRYDFERAGYPYQERPAKLADPAVYDTTQLGNSNQGHTFAASLSDSERAELLAYLKTF